MRRRTFFDDFRQVEGLVLPFQVEHEFGARLEAMTVHDVRLNPRLDEGAFAEPPPPEPAEPAPADGPDPAEPEDPGR